MRASEAKRLMVPPRVFRWDDGPEFRSEEFQRVIRKWRIREEVIPPGQPFSNGHIESYQGTMREELRDREEFDNLQCAHNSCLTFGGISPFFHPQPRHN